MPQYSRLPVKNSDRLYPHPLRNCRVLVYRQRWSTYPRKDIMVWIEIRVIPVIAIAGPPTSIDGKLR